MEDKLLRERPKSTLLPGPGSKVAAKPPEPEATASDAGEPGPWDDDDPLPEPGSAYVAACSRVSNKPEIVLHVMLKDGFSKGFAWSNFDSVDMVPGDNPGDDPVLVVRFAGLVPTELWISSNILGKLRACIGRQRIAWIREQPSKRGFDPKPALGDRAEIITSVAINDWKPKRPAAEGE
jgi:hypothetical protein